MSAICRSDLKHNFLKNIILRLDFSGVFPKEIENIVVDCKPYLKEKGFNKFLEKATNQYNVEITGSSIDDNNPHSQVTLSDNYKIFNFVNEDCGISIDISHLYVCLTVNSTKYLPFENYFEHIAEIYNNITTKIDFITLKRIGLRKINSCLISKKEKISYLFSRNYCHFEQFNNDNSILFSNQRYLLQNSNKLINFTTDVKEGSIDSGIVYQVTLDTDIYMDSFDHVNDHDTLNRELNSMNEIIFQLYLDTLEEDFKEKLCSTVFDIDYISGVESNE